SEFSPPAPPIPPFRPLAPPAPPVPPAAQSTQAAVPEDRAGAADPGAGPDAPGAPRAPAAATNRQSVNCSDELVLRMRIATELPPSPVPAAARNSNPVILVVEAAVTSMPPAGVWMTE